MPEVPKGQGLGRLARSDFSRFIILHNQECHYSADDRQEPDQNQPQRECRACSVPRNSDGGPNCRSKKYDRLNCELQWGDAKLRKDVHGSLILSSVEFVF